jgi:galactokinase/mevalonate kinase-like predicted kinase
LHALHAFRVELVSPADLAKKAIHVETKVIKKKVGSQNLWYVIC